MEHNNKKKKCCDHLGRYGEKQNPMSNSYNFLDLSLNSLVPVEAL